MLNICARKKKTLKERNNIILTPNEVRNFYRYNTFEYVKKAFLRGMFALVFYVQQQFMKLISESILTLYEREHEFAFFFRLLLA